MGHLLRVHAERATALPQPLSHLAWNYAADAEINDDLLAAGVVFPGEPVTPQALGCEPGGLAEDYYSALVDDDDEQSGGAHGGPSGGDGGAGMPPEADDDDGVGCGSGSGCEAVPGEMVAEDTTGGRAGVDTVSADLIREQVAEAVRAAEGSGRGTVPAGLRRWADKVLAPPVVPWRRVLRVLVRRAVAEASGRSDYSLARPSRRSRDVLFPGLRGPKIRVAIVVDTSGSMSSADLSAALAEVKGVVRTAGVAREHVMVLTVDAAAAGPQRVTRVEDIALIGGGGTDMRIGIAAAEAVRPGPDVVVVLSDSPGSSGVCGWVPPPWLINRCLMRPTRTGVVATDAGVLRSNASHVAACKRSPRGVFVALADHRCRWNASINRRLRISPTSGAPTSSAVTVTSSSGSACSGRSDSLRSCAELRGISDTLPIDKVLTGATPTAIATCGDEIACVWLINRSMPAIWRGSCAGSRIAPSPSRGNDAHADTWPLLLMRSPSVRASAAEFHPAGASSPSTR